MLCNQYLDALEGCNNSLTRKLLSVKMVQLASVYKIGEATTDGVVQVTYSSKGKCVPIKNKNDVDSLFLLHCRIPTKFIRDKGLIDLVGKHCEDYVKLSLYFFVEAEKSKLFVESVLEKVDKRNGKSFCGLFSKNKPKCFHMSCISGYGHLALARVVGGPWDHLFDERLFLRRFSGINIRFLEAKSAKNKSCCTCCCITRGSRVNDTSSETKSELLGKDVSVRGGGEMVLSKLSDVTVFGSTRSLSIEEIQ
ncbi:Uncharacterized protein ehr_00822 [Ehrlichia minasensis]|nr:Uncharacterized protein ehr_00822 [Ehrlichia minasensis]